MSLDITLWVDNRSVYEANVTHNLGKMAGEAGVYKPLWRPDEVGITTAAQVASAVEPGYLDMLRRPAYYQTFDAPNGWGLYRDFMPWIAAYLIACNLYPDATVETCR